jgi:hypothetical protein
MNTGNGEAANAVQTVDRRGSKLQIFGLPSKASSRDLSLSVIIGSLLAHCQNRLSAWIIGPPLDRVPEQLDEITQAEILARGYVAEYDDVFVAIEPELSRRETGLVMDILDMFTQLESSYGQLSEPDRESIGRWADHAVRYDGFDLNHRLEGGSSCLPATSLSKESGRTHHIL